MFTKAKTVGFWTPTNDTATAIGAALQAHWAAAKAVAATSPFWRKRASWLDLPRHPLNRVIAGPMSPTAATTSR